MIREYFVIRKCRRWSRTRDFIAPVSHVRPAVALSRIFLFGCVAVGFWFGAGNEDECKLAGGDLAAAQFELVSQSPPALQPLAAPHIDLVKFKKLVSKTRPPEVIPVAQPKSNPAAPAPKSSPAGGFATILPILQAKCVSCHGAKSKKGGLDLRTHESLTKGGNGGKEVTPGSLEKSWLWGQVDGDSMPPDGKTKLTADEKKLIKDWILGGAK